MKWVISPEHSGMAFGHYMTDGKRSPEIPPGIYEGEFNRHMADLLHVLIPDSLVLNPGPVNIPLAARADFVNELAAKEKIGVISIAANAAAGSGWSDASGFRVFHREEQRWNEKFYGQSRSLARAISSQMAAREDIPYKERPVKAYNFRMVRLRCPAVLVECGFMTCMHDAEFMRSLGGKIILARAIARGVGAYAVDERAFEYRADVGLRYRW